MVTTQDLDTAAEVAELLSDLATKADAVAQLQRDPSIPAGTVLVESEIEGAVHREVKNGSMVRMGKVPLPERFEAWDVYGNASMLPTAQMTRMLQKPNAERPGVRAFHVHSRGVTRENCAICPPLEGAFDGTCTWCFERTAGAVRKVFATQEAQEDHFYAFHQRQNEALQRRFEREMREAELRAQRDLANAMLAMAGGRPAEPEPEPEVAAVAAPEPGVSGAHDCPACGWVNKVGKPQALVMHQRRWCKGGAE